MNQPRRYPFFDPDRVVKLHGRRLTSRHPATGPAAGIHASRLRGWSSEFAEHRPYVSGDDLRYFDWKVFGRSDKRYVRQFEDDRNRTCHFLLDVSRSMSYRGPTSSQSKFAWGQACLSYLGWLALHQGDPLTLATAADRVHVAWPPSAQAARLGQLLDTLHQLTPAGQTCLPAALQQLASRWRTPGLVIVVSDFWSDLEGLIKGLNHMASVGHEVDLIHVVDRAEMEFPFQRRLKFLGLEGESPLTLPADLSAPWYRQRVTKFCQRLGILARRRQMRYERVMTEHDPLDFVERWTRPIRAGTAEVAG
ncbi:MAG: DUF58 domain-containing protein [Pirellulales bacterium]